MRKEFAIAVSVLIISQLFTCCRTKVEERRDTLFELMPSGTTGVTFNNEITTDDSIHILSYEYLYNGGGVGIGDFNNDSLPDIFFSGQMVPSKLYVNQGNFKFQDITEQSGIDTRGVWAYGVSVVDINQDGLPDIYLCAGGMKNILGDVASNRLYINKGDLTFEESAEKYGLRTKGESIQASFFDYDRDGDLDMYLLKGGGFEKSAITPYPIARDGSSRNTDALFRNDFDSKLGHPHFVDVSREAGILMEGFGLGVSIFDVNVDGWPDVYVTNDYLGNDHLYVNNRNGTFTNRVESYLKHSSHFAMGNDVGDINNDGKLDIVALDMLPEDNYHRKLMFGPNQYDKFYYSVGQGYGYQYMRNTLQLNNGNGSFSEIGQFAGISRTDWSWGPLIADFDNDGFQDIVVTNGYGKDVTNLDYVKFRQPVYGLSTEERRKMLLDRPPILTSNYAYKNNHDNTFKKVTAEWGFERLSLSSGLAYADFDLDGDLDLVINNINQEAFVYRNTLADKKTPDANYLRVKLQGGKQNKNALGASVTLKSGELFQTRYACPVRGFESTVESTLHFGLGKSTKADTLTVTWDDGRISVVADPGINHIVTVSYEGSQSPSTVKKTKTGGLLTEIDKIKFRHVENDFNDFLYQPLLQHKLSQEGPGIAVGDVNKDGLEDAFIGGSYRLPAHLIIQNGKGNFEVKEFANDYESEDLGALFFDVDKDGDQDLYVVSGGVEFYEGHELYQDRLYLNDGKGNFSKSKDALPSMLTTESCVMAGDYDSDGDLDLFVGGRTIPEKYPTIPHSYLLRNDKGKFTEVTSEVAPAIAEAGMVTAALWTDFDNDNALDLVVTGETMPIKVFRNTQGKLEDITEKAGLANSNGFWNSLVSGDFDNDGDTDYAAGNLGLNGPMKASPGEPITIFYADFDGNGSIEPIVGYYEEGVCYPVYPLDILASQLPSLKKTILYHKDYAVKSMTELVAVAPNKNYKTHYCKVLTSSIIRNDGNGKFSLVPLPSEAQLAPLYGMLAEDINADGNLDLLGVGNSYAQEIIYGRYDALVGVTFLGDGKGSFSFLNAEKSGFFVDGDAKGIARLESSKGSLIMVTQNNDSLRSFALPNSVASARVMPAPNETSAVLFHDGSARRLELSLGSTYLSQSSRSILINDRIDSIRLFDLKGKLSRKIIFNKRAR